MPRILYVFPHPDDESFGPGPAIAQQRRFGHEGHLLTLTRGEATSQRDKFGYSKAEMGEVRFQEMQAVARVLDLTDLTVLDFTDGDLAELSPLVLEDAVANHVRSVQPHVVATYAVHGISGHPDHLAVHAVVKRVFCQLRDDGMGNLRRLAFFTLREQGEPGRPKHLKGSRLEAIDCIVQPGPEDMALGRKALDCYETYEAVIREQKPLEQVREGVFFEFFQEQFSPPLNDLLGDLPDASGL